jgi:hypothetical protein
MRGNKTQILPTLLKSKQKIAPTMGAGTEAKTAPNFPAAQVSFHAFSSMGSREIIRLVYELRRNPEENDACNCKMQAWKNL